MTQHFQPISVFNKEPYKKILAFPEGKQTEIKKRLTELKKLGITHVSFTGPLQIEKCQILGKGYVGMVVLAKKDKNVVALKIRRIDSPRKNMTNEAKLLKTANKNNVGPKFIKNSKNFLIIIKIYVLKTKDLFISLKADKLLFDLSVKPANKFLPPPLWKGLKPNLSFIKLTSSFTTSKSSTRRKTSHVLTSTRLQCKLMPAAQRLFWRCCRHDSSTPSGVARRLKLQRRQEEQRGASHHTHDATLRTAHISPVIC